MLYNPSKVCQNCCILHNLALRTNLQNEILWGVDYVQHRCCGCICPFADLHNSYSELDAKTTKTVHANKQPYQRVQFILSEFPLQLSLSPAWQNAREVEIVLKRALVSSQPENSHEHLQEKMNREREREKDFKRVMRTEEAIMQRPRILQLQKEQFKWERMDHLNKTSGMEIEHGRVKEDRSGRKRMTMDHIARGCTLAISHE